MAWRGLVVEHDVVTGGGHADLERPRPRQHDGPGDGGEAVVPRPVGGRGLDGSEREAVDAAGVVATGVEGDLESAARPRRAAGTTGASPSVAGKVGPVGVHLEAQLEPGWRQGHLLHGPPGERPARLQVARAGAGSRRRPARPVQRRSKTVPCMAWPPWLGASWWSWPVPREPAVHGRARRTEPSDSSPTAAGRWAAPRLPGSGCDEQLVAVDDQRRQPRPAGPIDAGTVAGPAVSVGG